MMPLPEIEDKSGIVIRTFGHYATVLVDIDFALQLRDQILVEWKGYAFLVTSPTRGFKLL